MLYNLVGLISAPLSLIKRAFVQLFVWDSMLANNSISAEARHWSIDLSQKAGLSPASLLGLRLMLSKGLPGGSAKLLEK
jgi:hypothetical protein